MRPDPNAPARALAPDGRVAAHTRSRHVAAGATRRHGTGCTRARRSSTARRTPRAGRIGVRAKYSSRIRAPANLGPLRAATTTARTEKSATEGSIVAACEPFIVRGGPHRIDERAGGETRRGRRSWNSPRKMQPDTLEVPAHEGKAPPPCPSLTRQASRRLCRRGCEQHNDAACTGRHHTMPAQRRSPPHARRRHRRHRAGASGDRAASGARTERARSGSDAMPAPRRYRQLAPARRPLTAVAPHAGAPGRHSTRQRGAAARPDCDAQLALPSGRPRTPPRGRGGRHAGTPVRPARAA